MKLKIEISDETLDRLKKYATAKNNWASTANKLGNYKRPDGVLWKDDYDERTAAHALILNALEDAEAPF